MEKGFRELDSLDKFLTIYLKMLDTSIEYCKTDMFKDIYVKEKHLIGTIVDLVRYIEKLSNEELIEELKKFKNSELTSFLSDIVKPNNFDRKELM